MMVHRNIYCIYRLSYVFVYMYYVCVYKLSIKTYTYSIYLNWQLICTLIYNYIFITYISKQVMTSLFI